MEGSLKFLAIRQIFADMTDEDKENFFAIFMEKLKWKTIVNFGYYLSSIKNRVIDAAYDHIEQKCFFHEHIKIDNDHLTWIKYDHEGLYLIYRRSGRIGLRGHWGKEQVVKEFEKFGRDFFENKEYLWNQ